MCPQLRSRIGKVHADALTEFAIERNWLGERRARSTARKLEADAILETVAEIEPNRIASFVNELGADGRLSPALLLRAIVGGQLAFVEAAVAHLAGAPLTRVRSAMQSRRANVLSAIMQRTGLSDDVAGMVAHGHAVWTDEARHGFADAQSDGTRVLRRVVRELSSRIVATTSAELSKLLCDMELEIERHAALNHEEQFLLAA